jgi:hypothetical protein
MDTERRNKVTTDEFLEKFREFASKTRLILFRGRILRKSGSNIFCPITFVHYKITGKIYNREDFDDAGAEIGLTWKSIFDIMYAADGLPECSMELRRSLMEAAGIPIP